MKVIIFVLIAALAFCQTVEDSFADPMPVIDTVNSPIDFFIGIIEGLGIKEDIEKLKECIHNIKNFGEIVEKIKEALHHLKNLNPVELKKGFELLFSALLQLFTTVQPCLHEGSILKKLISLLMSANIMKIVLSILAHPIAFVKDVVQAIECFAKGDFHCAGVAIGSILRIIFL